MSFTAFILFGHICLAVPQDLDNCWNIYHTPQIQYSSERTCMKAANDYLHGAQQYYRRQKRSVTQLELYCIGVNPIEPI
mgnify:FL=1